MQHISFSLKDRHTRNTFFASLGALLVLVALAFLFGYIVYRTADAPTEAPTFGVEIIEDANSTDTLQVHIKRPTNLPPEIQAASDQWIESLKSQMAEAVTGLDMRQDIFGTPYTLDVMKPEFYILGDTASMVMTANIYTGGAHGIQSYFTITYNLRSGKKLSLQDVVGREVSYEELASIVKPLVEQEIQKKLDEAGQGSAGLGFFEEGLFPLEENYSLWYRDGDAIVFLFPPYQVAPYSMGLQRILVPIDVLKQVSL